ncbi:class I tRNA ligase family protein, partial [Candidatus Micrarchaeota archaeon]|nr:class I tRNA ligase family protein [Candidatus Micrarchaeota archaeon]
LLEKKLAYKGEDGSVYYNIKKFKNYGKLSGTNLKELETGASGRVRSDEYSKENASDFVLWKAWTPEDGNVFWQTELGKGRPGWHLECSAMSMKYLGESFDIHAGGVDLIFPHHENEIAQSEGATGKKFVNYWLHSEHLLIDGRKMSKSLGNFYTLRDLVNKNFKPKAIRYFLLSGYYKQQLNLTFEALRAAEESVKRLTDFRDSLEEIAGKKPSAKENKTAGELTAKAKNNFENAFDADLNTPLALAAVFEFVHAFNKLVEEKKLGAEEARDALQALEEFDSVLGVLSQRKAPPELEKFVEEKIREREQARKRKDFKTGDAIRLELKRRGVIIEDTPTGVKWKLEN